jgi:tRNA-dihydrouridine synthase B
MFRIGSLSLRTNVLPAPMSGISDRPTRNIWRQMGCDLVYTEMVSADGLVDNRKKSFDLLDIDGEQLPVAVQLFGARPETLAQAAKIVQDRGAAAVDLNMGCPARKVVRQNGGAALLRDVSLAARIVRQMRNAIKVPFTAKLRSGWDHDSIVVCEMAKMLQDEGIDAICLHPRTALQGFTGKANWALISEVKALSSVPIIGNGDIQTPLDVLHMLGQTGCDGVMIGRAAVGNPWILRDTIRVLADPDYAQHSPMSPVSLKERLDTLYAHAEQMVRCKGEAKAMKEIRKHIVAYVRDFSDAKLLRTKLVHSTSFAEFSELIRFSLSHLHGKC